MLRLAVVAVVLAAAGGAHAAAATTRDVNLNVTDQDPAGLNVRAAPAGTVITALKAKNRWVQTHVTGQSGAWARIDKATLITEDNAGGCVIFDRVGWVAFSKLGIEELNAVSAIHAAPSEDSAVLLGVREDDESRIPAAVVLGCDGEWLKVRVRGVVGWTRDYCSNQFTTCV
jgi:hypothetical protein